MLKSAVERNRVGLVREMSCEPCQTDMTVRRTQEFFRFLPVANEKAAELPIRPVRISLAYSQARITIFGYEWVVEV